MKLYGRTTLREFLGDQVVYRNLTPLDARLPGLAELREVASLPAGAVPRKTSMDYALVVSHLLQLARALEAPNTRINRLVFLGDTRLNDATAFSNLCAAGEWPGIAFIAAETPGEHPSHEITRDGSCQLHFANRWSMLDDFETYLHDHRIPVDEHTAVILDIDKTSMGARGRNDHVINQARVEAAFQTAETLIGANFDAGAFKTSYDFFNQPEFHPFTTDNQDYLVYICLVVSTGLYQREQLAYDIHGGAFLRFDNFLDDVNNRAGGLPSEVRAIHEDVYDRCHLGDPTPFKAFRTNEYLATLAHMGQLSERASITEILAEEIVITQEVRQLALAWQASGALIFGLSDKPDEASLPSKAQAAKGYLPIHAAEMNIVGA